MSRYVRTDELTSVSPTLLRAMLMANGWRETEAGPEFFQVLESPDSESGVSIPMNRDFRDYPARLNEALVEVEDHFGERARTIMLQLLAGPMDELFFAEDAPTVHGSIAWPAGEQLHETARDAFRAAAKSSEVHLPHFGNRGSGLARKYLNGIRMGQTERGSYVVTALIPIGQQEDSTIEPLPVFENILGFEDNFFRNVTTNLMQASGAAIEAAEEFDRTQSFEPFVEAVDYGVSAELIEALSKLAKGGQETEISVQWSPLARDPEGTPRTIGVKPDHMAALVEATNRLKEPASVTRVTVRGTVRGLDRPKFGQAGISTLDVLSGSQARILRVRLSRDQYEEAIGAHQAGDVLEVTGEQSREGNFFWLYNVRDIQIIRGDNQILFDFDVEPDE